MHVFSCRAFAHIHKDDRFKLDGKARQCIFLGYSDEKLSYRIWDLENKKVFRSRDEDQTLEDFKKETVHEKGLVDLDLIFPPIAHGDVEKVQDHHDIGINTHVDDVEQRERGSSTLQSPHQYLS